MHAAHVSGSSKELQTLLSALFAVPSKLNLCKLCRLRKVLYNKLLAVHGVHAVSSSKQQKN